jgi:uncharacterized protein (TIGR03437 family)
MRLAACCVLLSSTLPAAPVLRLTNSALVIAAVPIGTAVGPKTLDAYNIGDGSLALSASIQPGAPWLTGVTVGTPGSCDSSSITGPCIPLQFTFNTAGLARGVYTAEVTVADPNAIDAPQVVTITVTIGSPPPYSVERYLAPGQSDQITLLSGSCFMCNPALPNLNETTQAAGQWLSVDVYSAGTFGFHYWSASMFLQPPASMPPGTYDGTVAITNTQDDHSVPVTMHVTAEPIAVPSTKQINLRIAQGAQPLTAPFLPPITLSNSGMGTLTVQSVTATGTGVSAALSGGAAVVTVDPGGLAPGTYNDGLVTIQCNAANCPLQVPVSLQVIPQGAPVINYQGAVNNATFAPAAVAPGDVAVVFGDQLSRAGPVPANGFPLPTGLGGASVLVNDVEAPLYYSSYGQVAFQVPSSTTSGTALVQVIRDGHASNLITMPVVPLAPEIVAVTDATYHLRDATHPTTPGETLIVWCIGLGTTNPTVPDGTPAPFSPLAVVTTIPQVLGFAVGPISPSFAGLSPGEAGVYQANFTVPANAVKGTAGLSLSQGGVMGNLAIVAVN